MVVLVLAGLIHFSKRQLEKRVSFGGLIFVVCLVYLAVGLPTYFLKVVIFVGYEYLILHLYSSKFLGRNRIVPIVLMVVPVFLSKLGVGGGLLWIIGISFMTFRAIQTLFESKKPSPTNFFSFLTFFPALIAGPLDRYGRFEKDLNEGYTNLNRKNVIDGWNYLKYGIVQKFILGDLISYYWLSALSPTSQRWEQVIQNMVAYSVYFYFDFAGYSHLAMAFGRFLGIEVPANFNHPYLAENPRDFWQRWHITLGDFLKSYLFQPMYLWTQSFSVCRAHRVLLQNLCLFVTFLLIGSWWGLSLRYVLTGAVFGFSYVVYNLYLYLNKRYGVNFFKILGPRTGKIISISMTLGVALIANYIFSGRVPGLPELEQRVTVLATMPFSSEGKFVAKVDATLKTAPVAEKSDGDMGFGKVSEVALGGDPDVIFLASCDSGEWVPRTNRIVTIDSCHNVTVAALKGYRIWPLLAIKKEQIFFRDSDDLLYRSKEAVDDGSVQLPESAPSSGIRIGLPGENLQRIELYAKAPRESQFTRVNLAPFSKEIARGAFLFRKDSKDPSLKLETGNWEFRFVILSERALPFHTNLRGEYYTIRRTVNVLPTVK